MEPEICPPWWPSLIWWLIHHHPKHPEPPEPEWWRRLQEPVEEILVALATYAQAQTLGKGQEELRREIQGVSVERMSKAVEQLGGR